MSGLVGHTMYGVLGAKAAAARKLPMAPIIGRHFASYLAGAYLGCDVQTMPEAVCVDTGREVGYGTVPLAQSPLTGGAVRPWTLAHGDRRYTPREIHELFYGRAHVVFGFARGERDLAVPWDHLPDYFAAAIEDGLEFYGPSERTLAYLCGWIVHVVGDSLIKSVHPGVELKLLDGVYTPRNRPIQDLVTYHEIGVKQLRLDWPALFADLAATPIEPVQSHYMRVAAPRGRLGRDFAHGWIPERQDLLNAVLRENRRWVRHHAEDVLAEMRLTTDARGEPQCDPKLRERSGLNYREMVAAAEEARFGTALLFIADAIAQMFADVVQRSPRLAKLPPDAGPSLDDLRKRWERKP